jgi:succinate-semialdehyde dehydrogenase / glutarate-semialdehyde dehydrogenase
VIVNLRNPRTGKSDGQLAGPDPTELAAITSSLRDCQRAWESAGVTHRGTVMHATRDALARHRDAIIAAVVADTGRLRESVIEFEATLAAMDRWANQAPLALAEGDRLQSVTPNVSIGRAYRPFPLVGVISPWNFPLLLSLIDAIPALCAGSAVIVKPSEVTPRFVAPLAAALAEVPELPLAFAVGDGSTGAALLGSETGRALIDIVCFTGSVATGRRVASMAAAAFVPAFLELGGKDPAIVLAGSNLGLAAQSIAWGSTSGAGQACQSIERIYVHRDVHDEFVARLVTEVDRFGLAYPNLDSGFIGPIIAERQATIINAHLADAIAKGATIATGSTEVEHHGGGAWCQPTVLTGVDHSMLLMTEETFGPLLPVMAFDSVDHAVALANDTIFGLSAAVFGATSSEAEAVARRLDAGAVSIQDASLTSIVHDGEKMSFKASGMGGSRMGPSSIKRFVRTQALLTKTSDTPDPWWFPVGS